MLARKHMQESGGGTHVSWLSRLRWALPFLGAILPIVLLAVYAFRLSSDSVRSLVEEDNMSAATNVSQMITQELSELIKVAHAVASVPGTVAAMTQADFEAVRTRLKAVVVTYPQVDRIFVTDMKGRLQADYPPSPGALRSDVSERDWFKALMERWKPAISGVYLRTQVPTYPVIAIATPVSDEEGNRLGAMVLEYRTDRLSEQLQNIRLPHGGYVYVLDHKGVVAAHPHLLTQRGESAQLHKEYADMWSVAHDADMVVKRAEYLDPIERRTMLAVLQPLSVGNHFWLTVAQQPSTEAFGPLNLLKRNIVVAGGILTLFTLVLIVALARMRARNERLNGELSSKNQTLQDITSFVSHQLRAPVTSMQWMLDSMLEGDFGAVGAELKQGLGQLKDVAIQNGNLINDILNVSRIDRGVIEVQTASVSLQDIADRALRDYRPAIEKAGLQLHVDQPAERIMVTADKEKMAEAVTNSISNAIKHTKKGGITLKLYRKDGMGCIDVADTGEGMPARIMEKLFSRTGVAGSNTDSSKSTGLGLYIARNFMKLQGGDITVRSEEGKGTTFTYSIPLSGSSAQSASVVQ